MTFRRVLLRLGGGLLVIGAIALIVFGFASARTGQEELTDDPAVEQVLPSPNSPLVPPQSQIVLDLVPGYRGVLIVDGRELPTYDLVSTGGPADPSPSATFANPGLDAQYDPALSTVTFTPGEGATIEMLAPGRHNVTGVFWRVDQSREEARSVTWGFNVG